MARASDTNESLRGQWTPLRPSEQSLAYIDDLTGLFNYRLLTELLDTRWWDLVDQADEFALVMIDLDLFKLVNDRYGHLSGDEVLRSTGEILSRSFRGDDFVFRYGGDEFAVLLPGAGSAEATVLGERARAAMISNVFLAPESGERIEVPVSFSIGVASYPEDARDGLGLMHKADERLYAEKEALRRSSRRRKHLFWGLAAIAAVLVVILGIVEFASDTERATAPPDRAGRPRLVQLSPQQQEEKRLLLEQIEQLQLEVNELHRLRESERASTADFEPPPEISSLEERIENLASQLEARRLVDSAGEPVATAEIIAASSLAPPLPSETTAPDEELDAPQDTQVGVTVTQPRMIEPIRPAYPRVARRLGKSATIDLIVLVNRDGQVIHARTVGPRVGFGFEKAAFDAALSSKWAPGTRDGAPVELETPLRVTFAIENPS